MAVWADPDAIGACAQPPLTPQVAARTSLVYAGDGSLLGAVPAASHAAAALGAMSPWLPKATVAIEDRRFWRARRARLRGHRPRALEDLERRADREGGSTITQQLVRNLYIGKASGRLAQGEGGLPRREAREDLDEERILAAYLERGLLRRHAYGAQAGRRRSSRDRARASRSRRPRSSPACPQAPTRVRPAAHPAAARARRNEVLAALRSGGDHPAAARPALARPAARAAAGTLYGTQRAAELLRLDAGPLVIARTAPRRGAAGCRCARRSTRACSAARSARHTCWARRRTRPPRSSRSTRRTGAVRAMAHLPGAGRCQFNLASDARRQAGSAFKPFTLAAALEPASPLDSV